jgi:XTP/dITP diphosphohydrolase
MSIDLVIATTNAGKFREFVTLLANVPVTLRSLADFPGAPEVEEKGDTYAENAAMKAVAICRWTGRPALADDSGLEVDALSGAPGVRSARYAGTEQDSGANIDKLLQALRGVASAHRTARFRCVIAVARMDGAVVTAEGCCEGRILEAARGARGFGYDPIFFYPPAGRSFAELPAASKNAVSHRAQACAALRPRLLSFLETAGRP